MTKGARPCRLSTHMRSSSRRARAMWWYIVRRVSSSRPARCAALVVRATSLLATATSFSNLSRPLPSDVDGLAAERERGLADHLAQRRVGGDRAGQLEGRGLEQCPQRRTGDELGHLVADDVDPEHV